MPRPATRHQKAGRVGVEFTAGRVEQGAAGNALGHWGNQPGTSSRARRAQALAPAAALCVALLTACGGGPTLVAPATSTPPVGTVAPATPDAPTPAPATPVPRPAGLGEVRWSSEALTTATPAAGLTQLPSGASQIVANLPAYALPAGSQVTATWSYNNTSLDAFTTTVTIAEPRAEQWLTFQLSRNLETPWPPGIYEITISLNGQIAQSSAIEVTS